MCYLCCVLVVQPSWADLTFHVLAHLPVPSLVPASLYNPDYHAFVHEQVGAMAERPHGQDLLQLAQVFASHDKLARVQYLAALFDEIPSPECLGASTLGGLASTTGCDLAVRDALLRDATEAELLWATTVLELPAYLALAPAQLDPRPVREALDNVGRAAPYLQHCELRYARALGTRGRIIHRRIWIGLPEDPEHSAFQAAHEATVAEVLSVNQSNGAHLGEREVEAVALCLFASRSRALGLAEAHTRWRATWNVTERHCDPQQLNAAQQAVLRLGRGPLDAYGCGERPVGDAETTSTGCR